jgi:iron complex transport system substrate-binding protein/vitamin B12 transport system substrate-binding protein
MLRICCAQFVTVLGTLLPFATGWAADIEVIDDSGRAVTLAKPAERVITLTPHVTEMVFAAGGGKKIVATVTASDFPAAARDIPRVGDGLQPNPERIASFKPNLVFGWLPDQAEALEVLDVPVFISSPRSLEDIADNIETVGVLLGTSDIAREQAQLIRQKIDALTLPVDNRPALRVFVQAGSEPEYALGGEHIVSDIIARCGGVNVFERSTTLAPKISVEGVIASKPDLVLIGRSGLTATSSPDSVARDYWSGFGLSAAKNNQIYTIDADMLYRPGPRLVDAAAQICKLIQSARKP